MANTPWRLGGTAFAVAAGILLSCPVAVGQSPLYREGVGENPPFEEIRDSINNGYSGTTINVNNVAVEGGRFGDLKFADNLRLHTLANSAIAPSQFDKWSRWYQEDGATQIFRLFPGEENVRAGSDGVVRPNAARSEAFGLVGWNQSDGQWHDWVARYTIVKPIGAAIFQAKDTDDDAWSVQLNMSDTGRVYVQHRRPADGQDKTVTILDNAIGKSFDVRVRDNGLDYEVYVNNSPTPLTTGSYKRYGTGDHSDTRFRWGMYVGNSVIEQEGMIFISHASIDPPPEYLTPILAGDFNHDGVVDASDYTVWRDSLGATGGGFAADADFNRRVDAADHAIWRANFGAGGSAWGEAALALPTSVPEPSAVFTVQVLLTVGLGFRTAALR